MASVMENKMERKQEHEMQTDTSLKVYSFGAQVIRIVDNQTRMMENQMDPSSSASGFRVPGS